MKKYRMVGNVCSNINECDEKSHNCDANADCIDTSGAFTCQCKSGYHGTGIEGGISNYLLFWIL